MTNAQAMDTQSDADMLRHGRKEMAQMEPLRSSDESELYDRDFHRWAELQATYLREGRLELLDTANLIEEVESLGKSQIFTLRSSYVLIAMHLLKQIKQPERASASWENTINRERSNVAALLKEYPGLKPKREETFAKAYRQARSDAAFETKLPLRAFPVEPPFTLAEVERKAWWPPGFPKAAT